MSDDTGTPSNGEPPVGQTSNQELQKFKQLRELIKESVEESELFKAQREAIVGEAEKELFTAQKIYETAKETYELTKKNKQFFDQYVAAKQKLATLEQNELKRIAALKKEILAVAGVKSGESTILGRLSQINPKTLVSSFKNVHGILDTIANISFSGFDQVISATKTLVKTQEEAMKSVKASTALGEEYNDVLVDSEVALRSFGIEAKELADSTNALFEATRGFQVVGQGNIETLIQNAAMMSKFGIDVKTTSKNFDILTKSLRKTAQEADDTQMRLFKLGQTLNIPPKIIMSEFGPAMSKLAAHGDKAVAVFSKMAAASAATHLEMSTLLNIAEGFDTFSSAAEHVGKLNALLEGPYLDAIEMINATEDERIRMLIQSLELSGKSFDQLGRYEQKAIAAAAGITDMTEANNLFNTSLAEFDAKQMQAQLDELTQDQLKVQTKELMTIMDKFATIGKNFAFALMPVLNVLRPIADAILDLQEGMKGSFGTMVSLTAAVFAGYKMFMAYKKAKDLVKQTTEILNKLDEENLDTLKKVTEQLRNNTNAVGDNAGQLGQQGNVMRQAAEQTEDLNNATRQSGAQAAQQAKGWIAFGKAMLLVGLGVGIAAAGIALIAFAVKDLDAAGVGAFAIALGVLAAAFIGFGFFVLKAAPLIAAGTGAVTVALSALSTAFISLGLAIGLAGVGIGAIGAGIGIMVKGFAEMFKSMESLPKTLPKLGELILMSPEILTLAAAFGVLGENINTMMNSIDEDKLNKISEVIKVAKEQGGLAGTAAVSPGGGTTPSSPSGEALTAISNLSRERVDLAVEALQITSNYDTDVRNNSQSPSGGGGRQFAFVDAVVELEGRQVGKFVAKVIDDQRRSRAKRKMGNTAIS